MRHYVGFGDVVRATKRNDTPLFLQDSLSPPSIQRPRYLSNLPEPPAQNSTTQFDLGKWDSVTTSGATVTLATIDSYVQILRIWDRSPMALLLYVMHCLIERGEGRSLPDT